MPPSRETASRYAAGVGTGVGVYFINPNNWSLANLQLACDPGLDF
jgi:hypothetical protein